MLIRFLDWVARPWLKGLGYENHPPPPSKHLLPASHHYESRMSLGDLLAVHWSFLQSSGWLESRNNNRSYFNNEYQPWLTFPAIHFLEQLRLSEMRVVEFGGGEHPPLFSVKE